MPTEFLKGFGSIHPNAAVVNIVNALPTEGWLPFKQASDWIE
jgi:hypothetical protein